MADADQRYQRGHENVLTPGIASQKETSDTFMVDESGLPRYMLASRELLYEQLHTAAALHSGVAQAGAGSWQEKLGDATHIMQDYYAHSNFCEVAVNLLVEDGLLGGASGSLDTGVHGLNEDGTAKAENLRTDGGREVMATSSFVLEDTVHSLAKELKALVRAQEPFKKGGETPTLPRSVLVWAESEPDYLGSLSGLPAEAARFFATGVAGAIDTALVGLEGAAITGATVEAGVIGVGTSLEALPSEIGSGIADFVGADETAASLSASAQQIHAEGEAKVKEETAPQVAAAKAAAEARKELATVRENMEAEGSLPALYDIVPGSRSGCSPSPPGLPSSPSSGTASRRR